MISSFKGDALFSGSKITAGRRLANRPNAPRMPSRPASGLSLPGSLSHLGPPTAPRSTESDALHLSIVSWGSGVPLASIA